MAQEIIPSTSPGSTDHDVRPVPSGVDPQMVTGGLAARLAQHVGMSAAASSVFGAPIEQGGVTVIPVARVSYGFGGGSGDDQSGGGGGGAIAKPSGYIEIANGTSKFHRIDNPTEILGAVSMMIVASGVGMLLVYRGFSAIYRSNAARRK